MDKKVLLQFSVDHFLEIVSKQCNTKITSETPNKIESQDNWGGQGQNEITAVSYIYSDKINLNMGIAFKEETFLKYVSSMFEEEITSLEEDVKDIGSEFLNISIGKIKKALFKDQPNIDSEIPVSFFGKKIKLTIPKGTDFYEVKVTGDLGDFYLIFNYYSKFNLPWDESSMSNIDDDSFDFDWD